MEDGIEPAPLSAIVSAARSGSSWLGSIVDTVPTVAYRFEPFHRRWRHDRELQSLEHRIRQHIAGPADAQHLYEMVLPGAMALVKPPFFPKTWWPTGQHLLWATAKTVPGAAPLYERFKREPPPGTPVVFKDISIEHHIEQLISSMGMRVVYLVRHPCATVLSDVTGQRAGTMPTWRQRNLREYLKMAQARDLLAELEDRIDTMDDIERNAVLWRCDTETALTGLDVSGGGHIVIYEDLCDDPMDQSTAVLRHLGLEPVEATERYLDTLASQQRRPWHRDTRDAYFTLRRNPADQRDLWRSRIAPEQARAIERIVEPSWAFQRLAASGTWG